MSIAIVYDYIQTPVILVPTSLIILNTSRRALKPSQEKENRLLRTREQKRPTCSRNSRAKAGNINKVERDRARQSTQTADA